MTVRFDRLPRFVASQLCADSQRPKTYRKHAATRGKRVFFFLHKTKWKSSIRYTDTCDHLSKSVYRHLGTNETPCSRPKCQSHQIFVGT
jgi:hypothetical protein